MRPPILGLHLPTQCRVRQACPHTHPQLAQMPMPLPCQLPWRLPFTGPLLLLSLFDGVGASMLALLAMGATFAALSYEIDADAVEVVQRSFRHVHCLGDIYDFCPSHVQSWLASRRFAAVFVCGRSPCQDVSQLRGTPPGMSSQRTRLFHAVPRSPMRAVSLWTSFALPAPSWSSWRTSMRLMVLTPAWRDCKPTGWTRSCGPASTNFKDQNGPCNLKEPLRARLSVCKAVAPTPSMPRCPCSRLALARMPTCSSHHAFPGLMEATAAPHLATSSQVPQALGGRAPCDHALT